MKTASIRYALLISFGLLTGEIPARPPGIIVKVGPEVTVSEPVSPLLFSSFIELGFGRSENILAEMLFDRSFEIPDSLTLNRDWCVFAQPRHEMEEWWHSGYEENRWFMAKAPDDKTSSMERCSGTWPAPPNGHYYMKIQNRSKTTAAGLAQNGVWIKPGIAHEFSGFMCDGTMFSHTPNAEKPVPVEICLFPERKLDGRPLSSVTISVDATTCRRYSATLPPCDYSGRGTFVLRIGPGRRIVCDLLSLTPTDNINGVRREVIEAMKQIPASVIRFPGGCFASTYRWRDGVGEGDSRPVDFHNWWDNPHLNDFGTVEFVRLCRAVGSEPMLCVPVMFGDAENAADWVAFCNSASHPLHRKAGIAGPLHVKFWELENEPYRRLDAITYARRCVEFSRAMKAVDPTIQIIMGCYWVYHKALNEMLEIAGPDIDLINNRGGNIAELRGDLAVIARYNKEHQRNIGLCHSEYRANDYDLPVEKKETGDGGGLNQPKSGDTTETLLAKASRWSYGLSVLSDFLEYQDFGGAFRFANFTNYVDGWGENLINCAKSRVYPSAAGQAFSFLQRQHMSRPLTAGCSGDSSLVRVKTAWDSGRTAMIVFTLNLGSRPEQMTVDLSQMGCTFREDASGSTLFAASPKVFNQESMAGQIREEPTVVTCGGSYYRFTSKPWSATAVRIPR